MPLPPPPGWVSSCRSDVTVTGPLTQPLPAADTPAARGVKSTTRPANPRLTCVAGGDNDGSYYDVNHVDAHMNHEAPPKFPIQHFSSLVDLLVHAFNSS
jgi:hypothetical protein